MAAPRTSATRASSASTAPATGCITTGSTSSSASCARSSPRAAEVPLGILQGHVLAGRPWAHPDVRDRVLGDAGTDAHEDAEVVDRRVHHPVDRELLDLEQDRLALLDVALPRL